MFNVPAFALADLGALFRPGESLRNCLHGFARLLKSSFGADECLVVLDPAHAPAPGLYIDDGSAPGPAPVRRLDERLADALLAVPPERAVLFSRPLLPGLRARSRAFDCASLEPRPAPAAQLVALANLLEAKSFVSVPLRSRNQTIGRVHLLSRRRRYGRKPLGALARVAGFAAPLIENVQLVERLAAGAATQERRRISRDLHDSTVQPYIGLKLGLEALRRRVPDDSPVAADMDELVRMADDGISQLREYVGALSRPGAKGGAKPLVEALREQVDRFSEFHKIEVTLAADGDLNVPASLRDELLNVVREALSNIRRHTLAGRACVALRREAESVFLQIANDGATTQTRFQPRSIAERVAELGGCVAVSFQPPCETLVSVQVPLR